MGSSSGKCRWSSLSKTEPKEAPMGRGRGNEEELATESERIHKVRGKRGQWDVLGAKARMGCAKCSCKVSENEDR